jgi:hypothetical protein
MFAPDVRPVKRSFAGIALPRKFCAQEFFDALDADQLQHQGLIQRILTQEIQNNSWPWNTLSHAVGRMQAREITRSGFVWPFCRGNIRQAAFGLGLCNSVRTI